MPDMPEWTPSDRELDILKVLWQTGPASVREVHQRMCPQGELAFNTVQTLLRIMDDKGLVGHRTKGRIFMYYPKHNRQRVSAHFLNKVFDGSLDQLVVSMLGAKDVTPEELRELEQLIAQARRQKQTGNGHSSKKDVL
jgi:BlaI family transcriptional regulator, penicillinase repressor